MVPPPDPTYLEGIHIHVVCDKQERPDNAHSGEATLGEVDELVTRALFTTQS